VFRWIRRKSIGRMDFSTFNVSKMFWKTTATRSIKSAPRLSHASRKQQFRKTTTKKPVPARLFGGTSVEISGGVRFALIPARIGLRNRDASSSNSYTRKPICNRVINKCSIEGKPSLRAVVSWTKLSLPIVQYKILS
jgi:hypothetical protein